MSILQRIPDKYLIALELRTRGLPNSHNSQYVNYDGCTFDVSGKSLKKECVRRGLGEWESNPSYDWKDGKYIPNGKKSYCYLRKYDGIGRNIKDNQSQLY